MRDESAVVPAEVFKAALMTMKDVFDQNLDLLSDLDSVVGDGDHGLSMARGFRSVAEKLSGTDAENVGQLCNTAGATLAGSIGGATGPIFGTVFLRFGVQAQGKRGVNTQDLARMCRAALEGVQSIGKAQVGDKTVVDALAPAAEVMTKASESGQPLGVALALAAEAARKGAESTKALRATKGRARYQGEKSIGHQDAGATSLALIFETLRDVCQRFHEEPS